MDPPQRLGPLSDNSDPRRAVLNGSDAANAGRAPRRACPADSRRSRTVTGRDEGLGRIMTEAVLALGGADPATLGIAHEVAVDPLNGSASIAVPLALTPGRSGFGPVL